MTVKNLGVLFVMILLLNGSSVSAEYLVIEHTFDTADNWTTESYTLSSSYTKTGTTYVNISDGQLVMHDPDPLVWSWNWAGIAHTPSTTTHGVWSFDFNAADNMNDFAFAFMISFYDSLDGVDSFIENELNWSGYAVAVSTKPGLRPWGPGFRLLKYLNASDGGPVALKDEVLSSNIEGWNHIDIVRDLDNSIYVSLNGNVELSFTTDDNPTQTLERIEIANWHGNTQFDNIRVTDYDKSPDTITTTEYDITTTVSETLIDTQTVTVTPSPVTVTESTPFLAWMVPIALVPLLIVRRRR
ncbi:MAG: hypothetical protein ACXAE3_10705 [Candidatus Kariarchaeaceae archaeon]|jgi:hypothetical protein